MPRFDGDLKMRGVPGGPGLARPAGLCCAEFGLEQELAGSLSCMAESDSPDSCSPQHYE